MRGSAGAAEADARDRPEVSVVMSNFDGAADIAAAVRSVLAQEGRRLELIVSDDASRDDSCAIVRRIAGGDARVRLIETEVNRGPAAARNRAIDAARGDWIAIVDSDDLIHPRRLDRLISAAERAGADMVADDMVPFGEGAGPGGQTLFGGIARGRSRRIGPEEFLRSDLSRSLGSLGYCKPVIRRAALGPLRYDEEVGIGEDFDFCLRLLLGGTDLLLWPDPSYLYRRHAGSMSHRLSVDHLERQIAAHDALVRRQPVPTGLARILAERRAALEAALRYERLVAAIKGRRAAAAAGQILRRPALAGGLVRSLREWRARAAAPVPPASPGRIVLVAEGLDVPPVEGAEAHRVPPVADDRPAADHGPLALRLAAVRAEPPVAVAVVGAGALHAVGYLPLESRVDLHLGPGEGVPDGLPATTGLVGR